MRARSSSCWAAAITRSPASNGTSIRYYNSPEPHDASDRPETPGDAGGDEMTAYVIADINVTNPDGYAPYRKLAGDSVAQYGGRFLARGGAVHGLEGGWNPARVV